MDKRILLERLLKDEHLTPSELETVIRWIKDGSLDGILNEKLDELKPVFDSHQDDWDSGKLKRQLFNRIGKENQLKGTNTRKLLTSGATLRRLGIAAGVAFIFGVVGLLYQNQNLAPHHQTNIVSSDIVTKSNPIGVKTVIKLQDGSSVYLNAESSIQYPADFMHSRTIDLVGEAFFEVAHGLDSPFIVRSSGLETMAMGTSFNVRSYEEFPIEVVLATGKVKVENKAKGESINLIPGEGATLKRNSINIEKFTADVQQSKYWKDGTLHLDKLDFRQLSKTLERWYGVDILVKGRVPSNGYYSGTFLDNETLTNVLEAMKFAHDFEFQLDGKKLTIDFN